MQKPMWNWDLMKHNNNNNNTLKNYYYKKQGTPWTCRVTGCCLLSWIHKSRLRGFSFALDIRNSMWDFQLGHKIFLMSSQATVLTKSPHTVMWQEGRRYLGSQGTHPVHMLYRGYDWPLDQENEVYLIQPIFQLLEAAEPINLSLAPAPPWTSWIHLCILA